MKQLISLLTVIFLVSCGGVKTEQKPAPDNLPTVQKDAESTDSLCMEGILKEAIDSAYTNIPSGQFKKGFVSICDSLYNVDVTLQLDHFFSATEKRGLLY